MLQPAAGTFIPERYRGVTGPVHYQVSPTEMLMTRRLGISAVMGLAFVAGCTWTHDDDDDDRRIVVNIDHDGQLQSQGFTLTAADLPAFARERGETPVVLVPERGTSYGKAVEAKNQLKAAGFRNVAIGSGSGE